MHDPSFLEAYHGYKIPGKLLSMGIKYTRVGKICDFQPKSLFISETVRDRPMVTIDH